ncbi:MAG TPA: hypothetical protein PK639_00085 [Candidatus Woesebacteria bacterium]|nr:hypothetical protein [Candidatus Woesebacteria bacterium]
MKIKYWGLVGLILILIGVIGLLIFVQKELALEKELLKQEKVNLEIEKEVVWSKNYLVSKWNFNDKTLAVVNENDKKKVSLLLNSEIKISVTEKTKITKKEYNRFIDKVEEFSFCPNSRIVVYSKKEDSLEDIIYIKNLTAYDAKVCKD